MRTVAEIVGWLIIAMFLLGATGLADFRLDFMLG